MKYSYFTILLIISVIINSCSGGSKSGNKDHKNPTISENSNSNEYFKPNYNIYIENSASMDGYVSTESDFKNSVYGLVTDLKAKNIADKLSLNYITDSIYPFKSNNLSSDIEYFIKFLDPNTLMKNTKGRTTSLIPNVIQKVVSTKPDEVNILVSDFIFSSGDGNSTGYLNQQKNAINLILSDQLRKSEFSTIILKFSSQFKGTYFIESIKAPPATINCRRPYYIMIFGNNKNIQGLLNKIKFSDYSGFITSYYLLTPNANNPNSKLIRSPRKGEFQIEQHASKSIIINNAKYQKNSTDEKIFQFSVASNLEFLKMDDSYLLNKSNYELPTNYTLVSIKKNDDLTNEGLKGFTHIFTLKTSDLKQNQEVTIKLKSKLPPWVVESSTEIDSNPSDIKQQDKTFGFKFLIEGIAAGYENVYNGKEQFGINIKVSSGNYNSKPSTGFPMWILFILVSLIVVIIYFKYKKNRN
jgi:hypothetical protein